VTAARIDDVQLRFEPLDDFAALRQYRTAWAEIADEAGLDPGKQLDWLEAAWAELGGDKRLSIKVILHEGDVVGFAPLVVQVERRKGIPTRLLQPLGMLNPTLGTQFVFKPNYAQPCMRALFADLRTAGPKWDLLFLHLLKGELQETALRETTAALGLHYITQPAERSPYMPLAGSWQEQQARLQSRFRTTLRSRERRLREKGTVELRFCNTPDSYREGLDAIATIEADSWKSESGLPITHEKHWGFYQSYAQRAAKTGALQLPILYVNSEPVAFDYGVLHSGTYHRSKRASSTPGTTTIPALCSASCSSRSSSRTAFARSTSAALSPSGKRNGRRQRARPSSIPSSTTRSAVATNAC
jgi:CelD/BcsL family acetyltransferase involved in cellulose biosynthesis